MQISDILEPSRILVDGEGRSVRSKADALRLLSGLLSGRAGVDEETIEKKLLEREQLVSTGIGEGVAIPHTAVESVESQVAALILCPSGIDFDAVDKAPVSIIFGVIGPKRATGEHLRVLARISRLLRDSGTRDELVSSGDATKAYALIETHDKRLQ